MENTIANKEVENLEVVKVTWINHLKSKVISLGFLIGEDKKKIKLTSDLVSKPDDEMFCPFRSIVKIEKESILQIEYAINL